MNLKKSLWIALLLVPSLLVFIINSVEKSNFIDTLAPINDLVGLTLFPFIGSLIFKNKTALLLAVSIPLLLIFSKLLFYDGAERIVVVGLVVATSVALVSCLFGCAIKFIYLKHQLQK